MRNVKFSESYRFEMLSNYANSLSFIIASAIFNFFAYYINRISVTRYKNNKTCYKTLQKITDRLLEQKL